MAKKRDPFKQDYKVDDDWDLGGSFEDFDSSYDQVKVPQTKPKGRKPLEDTGKYVTPVLKGATFNAVTTLKNTLLQKMPKTKALADDATGFVSEFDAVRRDLLGSASPMMNSLKQAARVLGPKFERIAPQKLNKALKDFSKEEHQYQAPSKEDIRERAISDSVNKALRLQIEQTAATTEEDRFNTILDRKISEKRHKGSIDVQKSILRELQYKTEFMKTTTIGYYTKSLEIGMQQLYINKDILATLQLTAKVVEEGMKGLLHNSMLPDIQKQRMTESWKEITRGALIQKANSKMKSLLGLGTRFAKNLGAKLKDGIGNASSTIEMGASGVDMMDSMDEMEASMGGKKRGPGSFAKQGLEMGGGLGSEFAMWLLQKTNPKLLKTINKKILKPITRGPESLLSNLQNRANLTIREADRNREYGGFKNGVKNFLLDVLDLKGMEKDKVSNTFSKNPTDVTSFDIATRTSIVEIIPGYLSKILQQVTIANGKHAEELVYDDRTRDFMSSSKYVTSKMDIMHGEKSKRRGAHFARGAASLVAGNRYHAASKEENEKSVATFKDVRKDIETVMRNHAVEELLFRPEHIKEYADQAEPNSKLTDVNNIMYDYNKANYIKLAFTGVNNPAIVAKFLVKAMYDKSGVINVDVKNEFESAIYDLMGDDNYKDQLPDIVNSFGTGRFFKSHFDAKASKKSGGDLVLDKDSIIKNYQQNYNGTSYERSLYGHDADIGNNLNSDGTSIREMMEVLPTSLRELAARKMSPDRLDKRMFEKTRYNNLDAQRMDILHPDMLDHVEGSTLENGVSGRRGTNKTTINNNMSSKVEVIKTSGDHVLTIPINNIADKIDGYMTSMRDNQSSTPHQSFNNTDTQSTLLVIADHLASMREENKALMMAGMVSSAPGADPKKVQGVWKSIGKLGVSGVKGAGKFVGGSFKLHAKMGTSIASGLFKTTAAVLPSIINASGMVIGGGLKGAGSLAGSMITANKELFMGMSRGVGATLGAGVRGLGKLFGKSWGKGRDTSGRMSSFIKDIYTPTSENPVIRARDFLDGVYTRTKDGSMKLIHSASEIAGEVYNQKGDMLLSAQDAAQGLFDRAGKQLDFSNFKGSLSNQKDSLLKSGLVGAGKGLWNGAKKIASNSLMLPGSLTNKMAGLGLKGIGWAGKQIGALGSRLFGGGKHGPEDITKSFIKSAVSDKLDTIIKYIKPKDSITSDIDGDGIREGSYQDYTNKKAEASSKKTSDKNNMPPWMAGLLKKDKISNKEENGGILSTLFSFFGGDKLLDKFNILKKGLVKRLFGAVKGMTGLMGKGLTGLLGVFFGKGAMGSMMSGLGGILGKAAGGAKALAGAATAGGGAALSFLGGASKAGAKGIGAAAAGATGTVGKILAKAKSLIPDKLLKFFKIDKIAPMVAKKLGPKTIGTLAAKLLGGPFMWLVAGGLIVKAAATGAYDAVEILGLPEGTDIDVSDRLKVSLAAAICEGIFAGLIETKWFATSILGVTPGKYLKGMVDEAKDKQQPTSADAAVTEKVAAATQADQAVKAATESMRSSAATDKILQAAGVATGAGVGVTGAGGSKGNVNVPGSDVGSNINFDNIKPVAVGDGTNQIGEFVKKFESGSRGASTVAWDSTGGTSYGTYQLSSKAGSLKEFIEYCEKDGGSQGKEVAKLMRQVRDWNPGQNYKGTMAHRVWTELASKGAVQGLEHAYVQKKLYAPALKRLPADLQQQVSNNRGLQEMLWSMSVQHGSAGAANIWNKYWQPGMQIDQFVKTVYANRGNYFSSSTPDVQKSVRNRFKDEVGVILGLLGRGAVSDGGDVTDTSSSASTGDSMGMAMDNHNETMNKQLGGQSTGVPSAYGNSATGGGMPGGGGYSSSGSPAGGSTGGSSDTTGLKIGGNVDFENLHPALKDKLSNLGKDYMDQFGSQLTLTSGKRSMEKQQQLFDSMGPGRAAKPSPTAPHIAGIAVDGNSADMNKAEEAGLLQKNQLWRPLKNGLGKTPEEPWHVELMGSRDPGSMRVTEGSINRINSTYGGSVSPGVGTDTSSSGDATTDTSYDGMMSASMSQQQERYGKDTQRTRTNTGSTNVPAGGGAGSVATQSAYSASSATATDYRQPYSPSNATTVLQPVIDLLTTMSDTLVTIASNSGHLEGIKQTLATQTGAPVQQSASQTGSSSSEAPAQPVAQKTASKSNQAMAPMHAPINTSAKTAGVRPLS